MEQDGASLESSSYLNVTLRYLDPFDPETMGPWDAWTFWPFDLGTSSFLHHLLLYVPPTFSYLLLHWLGMVWVCYGRWGMVGWDNQLVHTWRDFNATPLRKVKLNFFKLVDLGTLGHTHSFPTLFPYWKCHLHHFWISDQTLLLLIVRLHKI